ncbi:MAG: hypothetical protein IMZ62_14780, partial [Chloroflexi bacterium]|nr:hypothetical protein [Chloroflexota bacterium]
DSACQGVRLAVELERAVVRDDGVRGEAAGEDVRIDHDAVGGLPARHGSVHASADVEQVSGANVLFDSRLGGAGLEPTPRLVRGGEVFQPEHRVHGEIVEWLHCACRFIVQRS